MGAILMPYPSNGFLKDDDGEFGAEESELKIAVGRIGREGVGNMYLFRGKIQDRKIEAESQKRRRSMINIRKTPMHAGTER